MTIEQKIARIETAMEEYSIELAEYQKLYNEMNEIDLARLSFRIGRMVSTLDAMAKDLTEDLMVVEVRGEISVLVENGA